jgi:hypothetical protein
MIIINYKFSVAQKMLCKYTFAASSLGDNFSLGRYIKERFRGLDIQITTIFCLIF